METRMQIIVVIIAAAVPLAVFAGAHLLPWHLLAEKQCRLAVAMMGENSEHVYFAGRALCEQGGHIQPAPVNTPLTVYYTLPNGANVEVVHHTSPDGFFFVEEYAPDGVQVMKLHAFGKVWAAQGYGGADLAA